MTIYDKNAERIKRNIDYLMHKHDISSVSTLAKILGVPATTIYSFLRNPLSNSKVKLKICNYFNISIDELENCDFAETDIKMNDNYEFKSKKSIISMSDDEIYGYLETSDSCNNELNKLKNSIKSLIYTNYRMCCGQAKTYFNSENFQKSLYYISSAFWLLKPDEIKYITEDDLSLYIDIAKHFEDEDLISSLIIKLESADFFNYKIMLVLANLLSEEFPEDSKMCYEIIKQKEL